MPIGTGGMATVYLARAKVVDDVWRDFALKLMHPHVRADPEMSTQLLREARLAARIRHANVVQVVEVADDPMGLFLVLDYIEGDALSGLESAARTRGTVVPPRIGGRILRDALVGLHAAHELKDDAGKPLHLVHRDFSPHNVLVGTDGLSRLADFGIAKAEGENATATGVLKGKVAYMAPEYVRGREPDRRSDIWSAGVALWELLAGRRPFRVKNDAQALLRLVSQPPPRIEEAVPDIPPAVAELVHYAMNPDVEARCPDALTFSKRLTEVWKAYGGIAEQGEVAEYVAAEVAPTLRERRDEISSISQRRALGSSGAVAATSVPKPPLTAPTTDDPTGSPQVMRPRRRMRFAAGAGGVIVGVVAFAALIWILREPTPPPELAPAATSAIPAPPSERSVVVRAGEPMSTLRVARRTIPLPSATREVEVALLPTETSEIEIEATSVDGRVATRTLSPGAGSLTLEFPKLVSAPPKPVPKRTPPRPVPKPKTSAAPGLAPTPFGK